MSYGSILQTAQLINKTRDIAPVFRPATARMVYKGGQHTGAMIALFVPDDVAQTIVLPDGEAADELHVTLTYLGKAADIEDPGAIRDVVQAIAQEYAPLTGDINGTARFCTQGEDKDDVFVLLPDLPALPAFRQQIVSELAASGQSHSQDHGYIPHITLKYLPKHQAVPFDRCDKTPMVFSTISLVLAGERFDYPLSGVPMAQKAGARHTRREYEMIQQMHDDAVRLGAVCDGGSDVRKSQIDAPNYRATSDVRRCDNCTYFERDTWCDLYDFVADSEYVCDSWGQRNFSGVITGGGFIRLSNAIAKKRVERHGLMEGGLNDPNTTP